MHKKQKVGLTHRKQQQISQKKHYDKILLHFKIYFPSLSLLPSAKIVLKVYYIEG